MIRREFNTEPGKPQWLLITQLEHARLSGELAKHWGHAPFIPLVCAEQLLPTVYLHDDGWRTWEQSPEIDSQTGRPLGFTEMPLAESLDIWTKSIERAASIGPLAAWGVAGHFTSLLSHADEATQPAARTWLAACEQQRAGWLSQWLSSAHDQTIGSGPDRNQEQAELALAQLKLFDWLSLWLCLAERTTLQEFEIPGSPKLTITPLPQQSEQHTQTLLLDPWPLTTGELTLSVTGRLVPVRHYTSDQELAEVPADQHTLTWRLVPTAA